MSLHERHDEIYAVLPEAYFLFKGLYRGIEVRVSGYVGKYGYNQYTRLWVKFYYQGEQISWLNRTPYKSLATARRHARAEIAKLVGWAETFRERGLTERADYNTHVIAYRHAKYDETRDDTEIAQGHVYLFHLQQPFHLTRPCPIAA